MLPPDIDASRAMAIVLIFALWLLYAPILQTLGRGTLNSQLHAVRRHWMRMLLSSARNYRVFDAMMYGHIMNSVAFFGSATLLVLAGLVGALANVARIHETVGDLRFVPVTSIELFTLHLFVLLVILAISFFSFTYAQRKLSYTLALLGGLPQPETMSAETDVMIDATATVLTEAVRSINHGIRGFYFALAALFLFAGPYVSMLMTIIVVAVLIYRQRFSLVAFSIERYLIALATLEKTEAPATKISRQGD